MTYKKSRAEAGEDARWKKTQAKRRRNRKKKEAIIKAEAKRKAKVVTDNLKWQYETEEWNELRERILSRDGNQCVSCYQKPEQLYVHHLLYESGKKIWEVPDYYLVTLCRKCHYNEHARRVTPSKKHF